jgi:hypothetical protein
MLPSCRPFLRFIGAEEKIVNHGFTVKVMCIPPSDLLLTFSAGRSRSEGDALHTWIVCS